MPSSNKHVVDETSPLLDSSRPNERDAALAGTAASVLLPDEDALKQRRKTQLYMTILMTLAILLLDTSAYLGVAPQTEIYERIVCDQYYQHGSVQIPQHQSHHMAWKEPEYDCTVDAVQVELAFVNQLKDTFDQIPGMSFLVTFARLCIVMQRDGSLPCP